MPELYARVILPLSLHDTYTYRIPDNWQTLVKPGQRVVVQFGSKKIYSALVYSVTEVAPADHEIKEILEVLDNEPLVLPQNFDLWEWMAGYYCCTLGDVFRAALPPGLKMESKSEIVLESGWETPEISESERSIIGMVQSDVASLEVLQKKLGSRFSYAALKSLLEKKVISLEEKVHAKYKPQLKTIVKLHPDIATEGKLADTIDSLGRAKKQQALLIRFCEEARPFQPDQKSYVSRKKLLEGNEFNAAVLNGLAAKNVLVVSQIESSRLAGYMARQADLNLLNQYQSKALEQIKTCFEKKQVALIHGITASGKTEIYIHLIEEVLKKGMQVLYLLPEIALTTQIIERLKAVFGSKAGIYHSRLNNHERVEIWNKVLQFKTNPGQGYPIILGARSALFMPFSKLGLIVVDEEHENTFKQFDPAPRYHARDMAVVMGKLNNADVLLGSATPSFESYFNALGGKYGLVKLDKRHSEMELPEIVVADIKRAYSKKQMRGVLTPELYSHIEEALTNKEQVVLFQNRRGYAPFVQCFTCGQVPQCKNCDVSLTYHKFKNRLSCHYCGFSMALPAECPECGSPELKTRGFGTEKAEEELKALFPGAKIDRMDLDTTRSKGAFGKLIRDVEMRHTDILIGTQMVTKGLDFGHVRVVGILNADTLINFPDFRAHERAYQLISQVSGRAGRKYKRGTVVLQTSQPEHPLIGLISTYAYTTAFEQQMQERRLFKYPPYSRLIKTVLKHKDTGKVSLAADELAGLLRYNKNLIVLGPEFPLVSRIQLWYQKEIWIKTDRSQPPGDVKVFIENCIKKVQKKHSSCTIYMDVDPY